MKKHITITIDHVLDLWRIEPKLTIAGFTDNEALRTQLRTELLNALGQIQLCYTWIQRQEIGKQVGHRDRSSYFFKHAVEFATCRSPLDYTYVSNGAMVAAAILAHVPYKRIRNSPNCQLAIRGCRRNRALYGDNASWAPNYAEYMPLEVSK